jgi:hypothetical protein
MGVVGDNAHGGRFPPSEKRQILGPFYILFTQFRKSAIIQSGGEQKIPATVTP